MKTVHDNIVDVLKDKSVLFLENDNGLYNGLDTLENILIENKIKYNCLFDLTSLSKEYIINQIHLYDAIVFQTTWTYDISKELYKFLESLKDEKIIIEHYINEPSWYYKPKVVHDVYICKIDDNFDEDWWSFYKLSDKPYWDYKNKFDK